MSFEVIAGIVGGTILVIAGVVTFIIKRPKQLKVDRFIASWKELQGFCRDKTTWPLAITEADKLLDAALKRRKLKGKTMGERMVSAQRLIRDNDDMWFAHNLAKKIGGQVDIKLKESDVKEALLGFRHALQDIGALPPTKEEADDKQ